MSDSTIIDNSSPIRSCMVKAVKGAPDDFAYGMRWVTSQRGLLKIFQDHLKCGDWSITYSEVEEAELFKTRSGFIPCYILKIKTRSSTYQFGLNGSKFWEGELPFEVKRTKGKLKYSMFSLVIRILLIAFLVWYIYKKL